MGYGRWCRDEGFLKDIRVQTTTVRSEFYMSYYGVTDVLFVLEESFVPSQKR